MEILSNLWARIEKILTKNFTLIFCITFFNYIPYGVNRYFLGKYFHHSFWYKFSKFSFSFFDFFMLVLGFFLILSFFKDKFRNFLFKIIFYLSFIFFVVELFLFKTFRTLISPSIIQILLETNKNEAIEFLQTYFQPKIFLISVFVLSIIYFFVKFFKKKINLSFMKIFKFNLFKFIFIIYPIIKIFSFYSEYDVWSFGRIVNSVKISIKNIKEYREIASNIEKNNITLVSNNSKIKNIIFIIGESTARNHMSLYNYSKNNTNPLLKKLEKDGNLYKFTDTISPHSHTIPVIKKLLTFYNYESSKEWHEYNNIIDIMKKAGYNTYWFSNQESFGVFGNVAAALGNRSDSIVFNRIRSSEDNEDSDSYDEQIVDTSLKYINTDKNFIVYHLLGTHSRYKNRYPKDFEIFTHENPLIAQYDNAVLYNDFIINKIISNFVDKEAIIIYVSDHGEEVFEFRNFVGHTEDKGSRYMIEIPFLIYVSDIFKENYPNVVNNIQNSLDNPYMTDDLIHTILDIADIKTLEYDEEKSVINPNFNKSRERIFSGKKYNEYWKNKD